MSTDDKAPSQTPAESSQVVESVPVNPPAPQASAASDLPARHPENVMLTDLPPRHSETIIAEVSESLPERHPESMAKALIPADVQKQQQNKKD